jgi:putative glycosyltransferase
MTLSIVTTLYRSEATVVQFHHRIAKAAGALPLKVQFIYVNDGSPDGSLDRILELRQSDARIEIIDLARNFGHHPALMTGLEKASGEYVFVIDSDLEEPPELITDFWHKLEHVPAADAVYGVQVRRKGNFPERLIGRLWYALFCRLTPLRYPADSLTARLMTRRFLSSVLLHRERDLDVMGLFALAGYEQIAVPVTKATKGTSSYTLPKRVKIAVTGLTAMTTMPLTLIGAIGALILLLSMGGGMLMLLMHLMGVLTFGLVSFVLWSIWFLGGVLLTATGIIALYIGSMLQEVKGRPRAIIRHHYRTEDADA